MTFGPLSVTAGASIGESALAPVRPNPTRGATMIDFTVAREARVRLSLFDVEGREVAVLAEGPQRPGHYQATWNGTSGGEMAPPGLYFVRYRAADLDQVRRVVVAR
jgi:hypothetical protein